jgi:hypothetical protein
MAQLNVSAPNLPLAPEEYERRYQDQLNNILRLFFSQISSPGNLGGISLNLDVTRLPTQANLSTLRVGDVYRDTTTGSATQALRIKVTP